MATPKRERQKAGRQQRLEQLQRESQRRRALRRAAVIGAVALLVIISAAWLFSGSSTSRTVKNASSSTTLPASSTTTPGATTTSTRAPSATGGPTQAQANALAVHAGCPASTSARVNTFTWTKSPAMTINKAKTYYAHFVTTAGSFVVKLDAQTAPVTVNNFVFLARHKYYNCVIFHRVIPGFAIQGGDPTGTGTGGPGYTIADELPKSASPTYPLYSLAMANTGAPHTGGSQFFIVTGPSGEALANQYSLFGRVISGTNVIRTINAAGNANNNGVPPHVTHRMLSVTISEG